MFIQLLFIASLCKLYAWPIDPSHPLSKDTENLLNTRDTASRAGVHLRTTYEIVWSCLVTILACVWGAVHPNIPGPFDGGLTVLKHHITTTICALIAPELMVMWALRQYFGAKKIKEEYSRTIATAAPRRTAVREWFTRLPDHTAERHEPRLTIRHGLSSNTRPADVKKRYFAAHAQHGNNLFRSDPTSEREPWTMTHAFFVQMGGFMLYEGKKPREVLEFNYMRYLIQEGHIAAPTATEAELKDRSKGNALSKCVIVLQTSWFVIQCLARLASRLPLSELEVVTLGFALMNGIVYWLWWDKPQGVSTAIPIRWEWPHTHVNDSTEAKAEHATPSMLNAQEPAETGPKPLQEKSGTDAQVKETQQLLSKKMDDTGAQKNSAAQTAPFEESFMKHLDEMTESQPHIHGQGKMESCPTRIPREKTLSTKSLWNTLQSFLAKIFTLMEYPFSQLGNMIVEVYIPYDAMSVPRFYAYKFNADEDAHFVLITAACFIGALFGAVHFFAWASVFPSNAEQIIWRVSVLITTAGPFVFMLIIILGAKGWMENTPDSLQLVLLIGLPIAYVPARTALLTVALLSLRRLPRDAFVQITWTSFIPHF